MSGTASGDGGVLVIEAARVFDGSATRDGAAVLVADGRVRQLGGEMPGDAPRRRFEGGTLLPGLIDAHVHLCFDGSADPVASLAERDDEQALAACLAAAERALRGGVTTVRDLGCRDDLVFRARDAIRAGRGQGPRILAAGRPLTVPNGHCWYLNGVAADEDDLLNLVRTEIERGAEWIKIMATGGAMTPSSDPTRPQFAPHTLRKAVDLAHRLGRRVAAHGHSRDGILQAVEAGVDTLEHGTFLTDTGPAVDPADAARLGASRTAYVATLAPTARRRDETRPGDDSRLVRERGLSPAAFWQRRVAVLQAVRAAGARLVAGSDAGVPHVPHESVVDETLLLVEAGLSPADALRAATRDVAEVLGVGDRVGRVAVGYEADLLVVSGDPLADPRALARPLAVFQAGREVGLSAAPPARV